MTLTCDALADNQREARAAKEAANEKLRELQAHDAMLVQFIHGPPAAVQAFAPPAPRFVIHTAPAAGATEEVERRDAGAAMAEADQPILDFRRTARCCSRR